MATYLPILIDWVYPQAYIDGFLAAKERRRREIFTAQYAVLMHRIAGLEAAMVARERMRDVEAEERRRESGDWPPGDYGLRRVAVGASAAVRRISGAGEEVVGV